MYRRQNSGLARQIRELLAWNKRYQTQVTRLNHNWKSITVFGEKIRDNGIETISNTFAYLAELDSYQQRLDALQPIKKKNEPLYHALCYAVQGQSNHSAEQKLNRLLAFSDQMILLPLDQAIPLFEVVVKREEPNIPRKRTRFDRIVGLKHTKKWRIAMKRIRDSAVEKVMQRLKQTTNLEDKLIILDKVMDSAIYKEHRNNFIFTGRNGNTLAYRQLTTIYDELYENHEQQQAQQAELKLRAAL